MIAIIICSIMFLIIISLFIYVFTTKNKFLKEFQKNENLRISLESQNIDLRRNIDDKISTILQREIKIDDLNMEIKILIEKSSKLETKFIQEQQHTSETFCLLEETKKSLTDQFKILSNEIFEDKSKKFSDQNIVNIEQLLKPVKEQIDTFKKQISDNQKEDIRERQSLRDQLESLHKLNQQMSLDANNLTNALKGQVKTQGTWGEMILEKVLEKSGLQKGSEYDIQIQEKNEDGKAFKPDVIIHLPEKRDMIIDSKVSLVAYEQLSNNCIEEEFKKLMAEHLKSIRTHIKSLSSKEYQKLNNLNSLDFVLLFIPIEGALAIAIQNDNTIYSDAFDKNIILVGPSTLLATLRTIENIWKYEKQNKNAIEIAKKAGQLYDKFVNFVSDLEEIGKKIDDSQKSYGKAMNKLTTGKGNMIIISESIKELGAKTSKKISDSYLVEEEQGL